MIAEDPKVSMSGNRVLRDCRDLVLTLPSNAIQWSVPRQQGIQLAVRETDQ
jgi:hypothetical protein